MMFAEAGVPPEELLSLPKAQTPSAPAPASQPDSIQWTYLPPSPRLGFVTGGTPDEYKNGNFGSKTSAIMLKYAKRKGYALYVDKDMARHSRRHVNWNKVHVMHKLLDDVPLLVWMDSDIALTRFDVSLEVLLMQSDCRAANQGRWEPYFPKEPSDSTFLWMSADHHNGGWEQYSVNAAPGLMALRRGPMAKEFLEKVWHVGDNPLYFMHHRAAAPKMNKGEDLGEWPYEQGAIWDVMAQEPWVYMRGACIASGTHFHSIKAYLQGPGQFANHLQGLTAQMKKEQAQLWLSKSGARSEIH